MNKQCYLIDRQYYQAMNKQWYLTDRQHYQAMNKQWYFKHLSKIKKNNSLYCRHYYNDEGKSWTFPTQMPQTRWTMIKLLTRHPTIHNCLYSKAEQLEWTPSSLPWHQLSRDSSSQQEGDQPPPSSISVLAVCVISICLPRVLIFLVPEIHTSVVSIFNLWTQQ